MESCIEVTPLERAMRQAGVKSIDLARAMGVYPSSIHRLLRGLPPSPQLAERIVKHLVALGADITELHLFYPGRYTDNKNE